LVLVKLQGDIADLKSKLSEGKSEMQGFQSEAQNLGASLKNAFAVAAGAIGIYELGSAIKSAFREGIQAVDDFKLSTIGVAATIADMAKDQSAGQENYSRALAYSKDMFSELELAAARYFASGKEMTQAWNILAQKGIVLRKDEIDSLGIIVDRIKLSTQGQVSGMQIAQEMRAILTGQARVTDQIGMLLKDRIPNLEEEIRKHREAGDLVKWLGDQFKGLKYASQDIQGTLESQKSTLDTLLTQVGRAGLAGAYAEITDWVRQINDYLTTHKDEIAGDITRGWQGVKDLVNGTLGFIKEIVNIGNKGIVIPITFSIGGAAKYLAGGAGPEGDYGFGALMGDTLSPEQRRVMDLPFIGYGTEGAVEDATPPAVTTPGGKTGKGGGGGGGAKSRLSEWQAELEAMKEAEGNFFNVSKAKELEFWKEKLALVKEGSSEERELKHRMFALQKEIAKENFQREIAEIKLKQESAKTDGAERLRLQDEILKKLAATYGKDSKEYIQAQEQKVKLTRQLEQETVKLAEERIKKISELNKMDLDMAREQASFKTKMGAQTEAQEIAQLIKFKKIEQMQEKKDLQDKLLLYKKHNLDKTKDYKDTLDDQKKLEKKHDLEMKKLNNQHTLALKAQWGQLWESVSRAFTMSLQGIITGTTTLKDALSNIWQSLLASFVEMVAQMALQWIASQVMMLIFGKASDKEKMESSVDSSAAQAGAAGFASVMIALPFPENVTMAPIVGGAAFTTAQGFKVLASAAGGWDVPEDTLAYVHKREVILPAPLADRFREAASGGGPTSLTLRLTQVVNGITRTYKQTIKDVNKGARHRELKLKPI
jgi:hypothetical protein